MSLAQQALAGLKDVHEFVNRSTRSLTETHSAMTPAPGMMSAAQQVAHAAQTIDWFMEGAFGPEGFDTNFEAQAKVLMACTPLSAARAWFGRSMSNASATIGSKRDAELMAPLPPGPIICGAPRMAVVSAITDHTARR